MKQPTKKTAAKRTSRPTTKRSTSTKPADAKRTKAAGTTKTRTRPAPVGGARLLPPESGATVRMYRQGLGDCFLITFPSATGEPFYMLIDCGVILGTQDAPAIMKNVVRHIHEATGGRLDVVVVTHEHWDHVSGFSQALDVFKHFTIGDVWFGWTENPHDKLATELKKQFSKDRDSLRMAVQRASDPAAVNQIASLLSFYGEVHPAGKVHPAMVDERGMLTAAMGGNSTSAAMQNVRSLLPEGQEPSYFNPGDVKTIDAVPGARFYVLGPPHDEAVLRRINPTAKGDETYDERSALTPRMAFTMALRDASSLGPEEMELYNLSFPFDPNVRISRAQAAKSPFFATHYGVTTQTGSGGKQRGNGTSHANDWRRIDDDWLGTAGALALQLDSYTNNTSLALAIELVGSKKVLLFAADAQVGNWLSWDNVTWKVEEEDGEKEVRIGDLLPRAVLYKVGHHGSHNATVRGYGKEKKGLELMTCPDLVAMIPVNHEMAVKKRWGKMPFDPLLRRLDELTRSRVMRIDDPFPKPKPAGASATQWNAFMGDFEETELYMQYTIRD